MKVYTRVVINMRTLETIHEESFDYNGSITECKGGGGGGGGGSGKVSYPSYMETMHSTWLTDVDGYINTAVSGSSPYASATAFDPTTALSAADTAVAAFNTLVDAIDPTAEYATTATAVELAVDGIISTSHIDSLVDAYAAKLNADYDELVAKLQSGSRDIGVAMTSAFVFAQGDLYAKKERDISEFSAKLYTELDRQRNELIVGGIERVMLYRVQRIDFERAVAAATIEANRIRIVAESEETRENYEYDDLDARWDLEMSQYGAQMMASIGGGTTGVSRPQMSKSQSALSGALSGAAMGAVIGAQTSLGNPLGVGIGAALGFFGGVL